MHLWRRNEAPCRVPACCLVELNSCALLVGCSASGISGRRATPPSEPCRPKHSRAPTSHQKAPRPFAAVLMGEACVDLQPSTAPQRVRIESATRELTASPMVPVSDVLAPLPHRILSYHSFRAAFTSAARPAIECRAWSGSAPFPRLRAHRGRLTGQKQGSTPAIKSQSGQHACRCGTGPGRGHSDPEFRQAAPANVRQGKTAPSWPLFGNDRHTSHRCSTQEPRRFRIDFTTDLLEVPSTVRRQAASAAAFGGATGERRAGHCRGGFMQPSPRHRPTSSSRATDPNRHPTKQSVAALSLLHGPPYPPQRFLRVNAAPGLCRRESGVRLVRLVERNALRSDMMRSPVPTSQGARANIRF
ncbi:hypothetical protein BCR34DRAFT_584455 [Clohesyomyces aquaticus]|uniref:Uncharacterized protein n=1 Tax=Clohesyomyces aquaticus TaxID=1231657 RepID=A0A1Y2A154_9PLEO|nr:hypothetical protein BCR34DRAFT_584455 [Clohesyomyces aquaticus]